MAEHQTFKKLSNLEIAAFCSQMAMVLQAGISSLEGIAILREEAESQEDEKILTVIYDTLSDTGQLSSALEAPGIFPPYFLRMCRIGEQSGQLDKVMHSLASFYEREAGIAESVRNAVTYPMVMLLMMLAVVAVLVTRVLPVFNQVFAQLGSEMNLASQGLMEFGSFLNRYGLVFIIILLTLAALVLYLTRTRRGQAVLSSLGGRLPFARKYSDLTSSCRFAGGLSLLLSSGFSPEESISMASDLTEGERFRKKLELCRQEMADGRDLSEACTHAGIFTGVYGRMILVAQKTGTLDEVMQKIAARCEDELDSRLSGLLSVLEPSLVAILSVITGVILLSVMLPLMGILSGM